MINLKPLEALAAILRNPPVAQVGIFDSDNAQKGAYNEFGTENAPARSFIRDTARMYWRVYAQPITGGIRGAISSSNAAKATDGVKVGAQLFHRDIHRRIESGILPPNSPRTLARKQGTTPLIDTGAMKRAIVWRMR